MENMITSRRTELKYTWSKLNLSIGGKRNTSVVFSEESGTLILEKNRPAH